MIRVLCNETISQNLGQVILLHEAYSLIFPVILPCIRSVVKGNNTVKTFRYMNDRSLKVRGLEL